MRRSEETRRTEAREQRDERWRRWMGAAQQGDREAYEQLLTELLPFVRGLVRQRIRDGAAAEDVVQEVLVSIHTARHTFRPERALVPWVRAIARNAVIDWGRRETRARGRRSDVEPGKIAAAPPDPSGEPLSSSMQRALQQLPANQREAVLLLKVEGLSVAEAALRLGVSPGAIKLRAHRGYRALRNALGSEGS